MSAHRQIRSWRVVGDVPIGDRSAGRQPALCWRAARQSFTGRSVSLSRIRRAGQPAAATACARARPPQVGPGRGCAGLSPLDLLQQGGHVDKTVLGDPVAPLERSQGAAALRRPLKGSSLLIPLDNALTAVMKRGQAWPGVARRVTEQLGGQLGQGSGITEGDHRLSDLAQGGAAAEQPGVKGMPQSVLSGRGRSMRCD